jgi:hypothetical protein
VDPSTGLQRPIPVPGLCRYGTLLAVAVPRDFRRTGEIAVLDQFGVYRLDTAAGRLHAVAKHLDVRDVEMAPVGRLIVGHSDGTLRAVDPLTGVQTALVALPGETPARYQFGFAASGEVYVASRRGIVRLEPPTRRASTVLAFGRHDDFNVLDLTVGRDGQLFLLQSANVLRVDPQTGARTVVVGIEPFTPGTQGPIAVDAGGALLLAGQLAHGVGSALLRVDPTNGTPPSLIPLGDLVVNDIAPLPDSDVLLATGRGLLRLELATAVLQPVALGRYRQVSVRPDGTILGWKRTSFVRVDPTSGVATVLSPVDPQVSGIAAGADGTIFMAYGAAGILRAGRGTRITEMASGGELVSPIAVALDREGDLVALDEARAGVVRIGARTGEQRVLSGGGLFVTPRAIAIAPAGTIYVADADAADGSGAVIQVDQGTGRQSILSSGGFLASPSGIAVGAFSDVLVADPEAVDGRGAIVRVDPVTGAQSVVAAGQPFVGLALVPGAVTAGPPRTTTTTLSMRTPIPEVCGNCIDDDGDGLIDYEDASCCESTGRLQGRWWTSGSGRRRLHVSVVFSARGVEPRVDPITLQVRDAKGPLRCNVLQPQAWTAPAGTLLFDDPEAPGIKLARVRSRTFGMRLEAVSRKGVVAGLRPPALAATLHVGGRCATGVLRFRRHHAATPCSLGVP